MTIDSKPLVDAFNTLPDYLQDKIYDPYEWKSLSYAESVQAYFYSWRFPDYNRLLNARQDRTLHLFTNKSCLFDYTKEKVGGISQGVYPTINNRKIAGTFVISVRPQTSYFEIRDGFELIEHFTQMNSQVASHVWSIPNELKIFTVKGEDEFCWVGRLNE